MDRSSYRDRSDGPGVSLYDVVLTEVSRIQPYGIFVKIPGCRKNGLVHKSQMSRTKVEHPEDMVEVGERVWCKIISVEENGEKLGLSMKVVSQTNGKDLDPNHVQTSLDEQRRKTSHGKEKPRIELGAVLDTTCKKCGGKGHFSQDCFYRPGEDKYDLLPSLDYLVDQAEKSEVQGDQKQQKKKKEKKHKKKKKKQKKQSSDSSSDEDEEQQAKKRKKNKKAKKTKKHRHVQESSESEDTEGSARDTPVRKRASLSESSYHESSRTEHCGDRETHRPKGGTAGSRRDNSRSSRQDSKEHSSRSQYHHDHEKGHFDNSGQGHRSVSQESRKREYSHRDNRDSDSDHDRYRKRHDRYSR